MQRILILPGSTSPIGSDYYKQVYATIEKEAARRGLESRTVIYPGQGGESSGVLTYAGAVEHTLNVGRKFRPSLLIGRSFGCSVATGVLGSNDEWLNDCRTAVLWGPCTRETLHRIWPTKEKQQAEIEEYERNGTHLLLEFFNEYPAIEELIAGAKCNLRLIRGSEDIFNSNEDLEGLAATHRRSQQNYTREIVVVDGLKHTVIEGNVSPELLSRYYRALFDLRTAG
jgi:hypothetical protein